MKVLYVLKRFPRLSETFVLHELLRLEAAGVPVGVVSLKDPNEPVRHPEVARLQAPITYLDGADIGHLAAGVAEVAARGGYSRLHAHFATSATEVATVAGRLTGIPVTVTAHAKDIFHRDYAPTLADRLVGVAAVVTVSRYNAAHLRSVLGGVTPIEVVYNGIADVEPVEPRPGGPVLSVARFVPKKGLDLLIEAAAVLARTGSPVPVELVGDGPLREGLEVLARRLGVDVRFRGALTAPDVHEAYRRASMFVLPCRIDGDGDRDGMPTVLGEAMKRGLPVVSTDLIGIPELVRHEETGLLAAPEDPASLAEAIARLRNDPALAGELAVKGCDHATRLLDPGVATESLMEVWRRC